MAKGNIGKRSASAMMAEARFVGQLFGRLLVQRYAGVKIFSKGQRHSLYECLCACGTIKIIDGNALQTKSTQSCGCLQRESRFQPKLYKRRDGTELRRNFRRYQDNAKTRGLDFELTLEQARDLFAGTCYYCGASANEAKMGIDRLINSLGYQPLNCVSCCWPCNSRKGRMDAHVFLAWAERVVGNQRNRNDNQNETIYDRYSSRA